MLLQSTKDNPSPTNLFDHDPKTTLAYEEKLIAERGGVKIFDASYASPKEGRVPVYVIVPPGKGPVAGIVLQQGGGQNRLFFLSETIL